MTPAPKILYQIFWNKLLIVCGSFSLLLLTSLYTLVKIWCEICKIIPHPHFWITVYIRYTLLWHLCPKQKLCVIYMNLDQVMLITFNIFCTLFLSAIASSILSIYMSCSLITLRNHRFYTSYKVFIQLMEGGTPLFKYAVSVLLEKIELENINWSIMKIQTRLYWFLGMI